MKKRLIPIAVAVLLIIMAVVIMIIGSLIKKYTPTDERADLNEYFSITNEKEVALLLQDEVVEEKGLLIDGVVYVDYDTVKSYFNSRFYWDSNENVLLYTTPTDLIKAEIGSKDYYVTKTKNSENYVILKVDGDRALIAIDFVQKYTNIEYEFLTEPNRMHVTYNWGNVTYADVKKADKVRYQGGIKSKILTEVSENDMVVVLEEGDSWTKVRTLDGFIGYIENKRLSNIREEETFREFEEPVYTNISKDYTINMVWHQVTNQTANDTLMTALSKTKGVNTISPTWFSLSDNEGNVSSLASASYVEYAHQQGVEVWALVDNFNPEVSTYDVLSYTSKREKLINSLIASAIELNLDGINIDFEQLSVEAGEPFIQFIRELSIKCRNNGIILSIDNYVPEAYTSHYNRTEQGMVADYVVIMGYDEHYAGSEVSGSVASIDFVENGILNTLKEVPAEKIISGIPFYSRLWKETPKTEEEIAAEDSAETEEYIPYTVTSEALGMTEMENRLAAGGVTPVWDEITMQYYGEYEVEGSIYKVWLEEEKSIEEKMKLMKENNLAGVACWKLGLEKESIWDTIIKYTN